MSEQEKILEKLEQYKRLVHSQDPEDGEGLWAQGCACSLISGLNLFSGREHIESDFLGLIREHYSKIDLIDDHVEVRLLNEESALVIFAYHTECVKRETGAPYGILGLETQIYRKENGTWRLVHVQYSGKPVEEG